MLLRTASSLITLDGVNSILASASNQDRVAIYLQLKSGMSFAVKFGGAISVIANSGITDGIDVTNNFIIDQECPQDGIFLYSNNPSTVVLLVETFKL